MSDCSERGTLNWAAGFTMAALILIGPVLALLAVVAGEMLIDVLTMAGAPAIGAMAAGVVGWILVLKYRPQPQGSPVGAEGD
jgi:hypothetical protein